MSTERPDPDYDATDPAEGTDAPERAAEAERATGADGAELATGAESTDQTEPVESAGPADQTEPVESADLAERAESAAPKPVARTTPAESADKAERGESTERDAGAESTDQTERVEGNETADLAESPEPAEPAEPAASATPAESADEAERGESLDEAEPFGSAEPAEVPHAAEGAVKGPHAGGVRHPDEVPHAVGVPHRDEVPHAGGVPHPDEVPHAGGDGMPRRRRPSLVVASVAAAVLLVGGGGAYLAASTTGGQGGSGTPGGDGTPPQLALDGYTGGGKPGIAVGEPDPNGVTYRADGTLPGGPGSAPVYTAKGEVTEAEVARLAKALDVAGTPKLVGEAWKIGPQKDGSGPSLSVNQQAPGIWTFSRYAPGTAEHPCESTTVCTSTEDSAPGPVGADASKKAVAPVLKALGQDDAKLDASQLMGSIRVVNAQPKIGGLPTYGWTTGIQVAADGQVVSGTGNVKAPVKGATYPVISAKRTLALLNSTTPGYGRKGIGGCAGPVPLKDRDETPCKAPATLPKQEPVTVESAVFGLASHLVDGRRTLVPSWLFEVRPQGAGDSFTVTHPAVEPKYLTSPVPSSQPLRTPSPAPTSPGDEPSSPPKTRDVKVEGYTADGKDLTVRYTGGVCGDYAATASETSGKVTVTVTETPWQGKVCIMIAKIYHKTVHLDQPLGDREVVGADGKKVPEEKTDPSLEKSAQPQ